LLIWFSTVFTDKFNSAQAQWKVTPEAGMNVTKYKGDVAKVGFKAGAAVSYVIGYIHDAPSDCDALYLLHQNP